MNSNRTSAFSVFCLILAAACGKNEGAPVTTSTAPGATAAPGAEGNAAAPANARSATCDSRTQNGKCAEHIKLEDLEEQKKTCVDYLKGTWSTTSCQKEQAIASCTKDDRVTYYFKGTPVAGIEINAEFAQLDCEMVSGKVAMLTPAAAPGAAAAPKAPTAKRAAK